MAGNAPRLQMGDRRNPSRRASQKRNKKAIAQEAKEISIAASLVKTHFIGRSPSKRPQRVDYEYERCGTACVFMFTEPLAGWRQVSVRDRRTKIDWALEMESLLTGRYKDADKIVLICDNLNTHTKGAFYEIFKPEKARSLVKKIEFRYTPKHGSWLNAAENELSSMTRQCVAGRRFPTITLLKSETKAWTQNSNQKHHGVDWQFQIDDARLKLNSLYPKIKS